jgi:hypothetical protein
MIRVNLLLATMMSRSLGQVFDPFAKEEKILDLCALDSGIFCLGCNRDVSKKKSKMMHHCSLREHLNLEGRQVAIH